ncbi:hypothetical protein A2634_05330 [Candidatus Amesbacteria bacterium RIFCSPHIGHO2_01_FULL_48_32]|uniref:Uncharacterized protein n=1 Tax=Candidatus Amesbacteria bacterium RIFCSPLOWO2_01_FULL_48_25 TaxID=1797259 RepID=A0A1F4ZCK2_9BACT|nr:MAG: hypothetical protein A2634_05330 [Candidatus Amesbacteria bacterium RIFCSPHIGHO2_01_FULL_48_32]OGD04089.1 MAG: hypothetical protein A2989_01675 [Candidatus Amesbacteria bacterium RIFCSPLOWO2_01_FULL_48_25]HJZ05645.1 hypothetical protein [Patescibacteria group bacterium]
MRVTLNTEQARGLSNFFFDVAKGLILGGIGLSLAVPLAAQISLVIVSSLAALVCVRMALYLLQDFK